MDRRQLELILKTTEQLGVELKGYLAPLGLSSRAVTVLCFVAEHGDRLEVGGQSASKVSLNKRDAAKRCGTSPNTYLAGVHDLETIGVVGVLKNTAPWTVIVNWSRVARLEPLPSDPLAALPIFSSPPPSREASTSDILVNPGQPWSTLVSSPVSVNNVNTKSVYRVEPCTVRSTTELTKLARPWAIDGGVTDRELQAAVTRCGEEGQLLVLRRLYNEAVRQGTVGDSEDSRLRFLTIAHHCATSEGLHRRMGALVAKVKRNLDCSRIPQRSEAWAAQVLKRQHASGSTSPASREASNNGSDDDGQD